MSNVSTEGRILVAGLRVRLESRDTTWLISVCFPLCTVVGQMNHSRANEKPKKKWGTTRNSTKGKMVTHGPSLWCCYVWCSSVEFCGMLYLSASSVGHALLESWILNQLALLESPKPRLGPGQNNIADGRSTSSWTNCKIDVSAGLCVRSCQCVRGREWGGVHAHTHARQPPTHHPPTHPHIVDTNTLKE